MSRPPLLCEEGSVRYRTNWVRLSSMPHDGNQTICQDLLDPERGHRLRALLVVERPGVVGLVPESDDSQHRELAAKLFSMAVWAVVIQSKGGRRGGIPAKYLPGLRIHLCLVDPAFAVLIIEMRHLWTGAAAYDKGTAVQCGSKHKV